MLNDQFEAFSRVKALAMVEIQVLSKKKGTKSEAKSNTMTRLLGLTAISKSPFSTYAKGEVNEFLQFLLRTSRLSCRQGCQKKLEVR